MQLYHCRQPCIAPFAHYDSGNVTLNYEEQIVLAYTTQWDVHWVDNNEIELGSSPGRIQQYDQQ